MESNLIRTLFRKLLDALRMSTPPDAREVDAPEQRGRQVFSVVSDGVTIRGEIRFPVTDPARLFPTVILCHGIPAGGPPQDPDDPGYDGLMRSFGDLGLASVFFNFRGCGESDGNFDMHGWVRDLEVVTDHVLETPHVDPSRVMLVGFSGGGAAAIRVASENDRIFGLASVATPAHFGFFKGEATELIDDFRQRGIIRDPEFPPDPHAWMEHFGEIEPKHWIAHVHAKYILILHGEADELVSVEHARDLYQSAPAGVAELVLIPDAPHRLRNNEACRKAIKDWLLRSLGWEH